MSAVPPWETKVREAFFLCEGLDCVDIIFEHRFHEGGGDDESVRLGGGVRVRAML